MSLKETERKIYQREESPPAGGGSNTPVQSRSLNPHISNENPFAASSLEEDLEKKKEVWIQEQEVKKEKRNKLIKKIAIIFGVIVVVFGVVWLALYFRKSAFSEDQVKVSISGPEKVKSGDAVSFEINYQNLNRASLKNAVLYVSYSENFKPSGNLQFESEGPSVSKFNIGDIAEKSGGKMELQGKFFGPQDALVYVGVKIDYKPSTFNSTFSAKAGSSVFISSSPIQLETSGSQNAAAGNSVSYTVTYRNTGQETFNDLKIKADFPDGFSFSNSEPLPAQGNNIWYVGALETGQAGFVKINGIMNGARDEEKKMKFYIGEIGADNQFISYGETQSTTKIIGSPLVLSETINDKKENVFVNAGESLLFKINYKNTGSIGLRDVVLMVEASSPILDYARMDMRDFKGEFDPEKKIITLRASEVPNFKILAPGAEGEISFIVPVKDIIPVSGPNDKRFSFSAIARMDSPDIPTVEGSNKIVASNTVEAKLNSKLIAKVEGFYNDADIPNSGPLPLKVGQKSTFTLHMKAANVSNDATDAKMAMTLAPGAKWENNFLPRDAAVNFNDRTSELVWNIGSLSAGTGIITNPKELIFQIGIMPSQNQVGDFAALLSKTVFSAKDAFTGQPLEAKLGEKNTNLMEDLGVGDTGKVTP
ncbi:MAG: hypothetical protein WC726_00700 [Parcubacteria group bacterium]|jgi:uncharacterized repeat protein (TIGR01451 family)